MLELVLHDVGDLAAAQEVQLEQRHRVLGQPAQVGHMRCRDAERIGERLDPRHRRGRRWPIRQGDDQHAVDQLLPQLGSGEAGSQLGRQILRGVLGGIFGGKR